MTARSTIELTTFAQIEAGVGMVLLWVAGSTSEQLGDRARPWLLLIEDGQIHRLSALPAPSDPAGVLRAAYSATAPLVGPATEFALEFDDGTRVELPAPSIRPGPGRASEPAAPSVDSQSEDRRLRASPEAAAAEREMEVHRLRTQLVQQSEDGGAASATPEAPALAAELREARALAGDLAAELDEAQTRADTLAEVVRAETARRENTERALQMAHQEIDALRLELERAQLEAEAQLRQPTPRANALNADGPKGDEQLAALDDDPPPGAPGSGSAREPQLQEVRSSSLAPPGAPAQAAGPPTEASPRGRGAVHALPAEVTAGLLLFVLGIILAVLALTGQLG